MAARRITLFSLATCLVLWAASPIWGIPISWDRGGGSNLASNPLNWNPNQIPTSADDVVLNALASGDDPIVDLSNVLNQPGQVRRVETTVGSDNYTVNNGTIELFLTVGNALLTRGGSLTINSDVRFGDGSTEPRFNTIAGAPPIVVNGTVAPSDSNSAAVTLELTSRNLTAGPQVSITGVISDGANPSSTLALTAGFGPDSENHRGVVRVTGDNTYTGQTIVNGATLEFDSIGNVGGGVSALGAPTTVGNGTIRLGAIDTSGVRVPGTLTYIGTSDAQTDRQIQLEGDGGIIKPADTAGSLTLNGDIFSNNPAVNPILQLHGSGNHEISGDISESGTIVRVVKVGTGTWRLSGNNSYTGITINNGGRLIVDTNSLPAAGGVFNNGELEFDQTTSAFYSGVISGIGDLIKSGNIGSLILTGANTYMGDTIITDGSISTGTIADTGGTSGIGKGNTVRLNNGALVYTGSAMSTNRNFVIESGATTAGVSSFGGELTISGIVSGTGVSQFKLFGDIQLTEANTYTGNTLVDVGTLRVNNISGSGTGTGDVSVGPTGTLGGMGTISGAVSVENGGTLAPGEFSGSVGTLTVGDVTFNAGSTFKVELTNNGGAGIDHDRLGLSSTSTINGGTLDVSIDFNPTLGDLFELFLFVGGAPVSGVGFDTLDLPGLDPGLAWSTSNLLSEGILAVVAGLSGDFDADNDVDGGDFLAWQRGEVSDPPSASDLADWEANFGTAPGPIAAASTAIPEPSGLALFAVGWLVLALNRRRAVTAAII